MTGRLAQICRHPIKGHGREDLASVRLLAGECLPWDRHWAVAHEAAQIQDGWNPCVNFARGAKAPALMAITSRLDEASGVVTLAHPDRGEISFDPDAAQDLPRFLDWVRPLNPQDRAQPVQIVSAGRGMTDSDFPSISVLSTASLADLSVRMGQDLSPHRFRGNLWLDGAEPWAEFGWIGRTLRIGGAVLRLEERITRCKATTVDPETGLVAGDTLGALDQAFGHQDFGVYAVVIEGGPIAVGDEWSLI
ncbi:MAG: molybdenum cofactor biosysynthesis protein [Rhodobacterales bacterium RIFCSPHIGHO2_02_FULL_62_130]|nr:MAG: molybdenum cofactor biosysynthesis protein [Rhodobacterales bacterium RIFCSPHIGHO2_02_FULL_62_130]OHC60873.1 MAG: molybdenum cofactor biosysynthesis protein [Rhodobacterales bacterium RIFCSPHIGHO2_12_FULL_62_75]HCY99309.1 molybdenum cofactor biosysynthesis protein [Rhodobacter sp.]